MQTLKRKLLENFAYQKQLLLQKAGVRDASVDVDRMGKVLAPHLDKLADMVQEWDVEPSTIIEAAFAWAKKNRHPDGPMLQMLANRKYLLNALSYHLEVPKEAIMERRCKAAIFERMDDAFMDTCARAMQSDVDLEMQVALPVEHRYIMAMHGGYTHSAKLMAPQVLSMMQGGDNPLLRYWLAQRGYPYEAIAEQFNKP